MIYFFGKIQKNKLPRKADSMFHRLSPNFVLDFLEPLKLESRKGKAFPFGII